LILVGFDAGLSCGAAHRETVAATRLKSGPTGPAPARVVGRPPPAAGLPPCPQPSAYGPPPRPRPPAYRPPPIA